MNLDFLQTDMSIEDLTNELAELELLHHISVIATTTPTLEILDNNKVDIEVKAIVKVRVIQDHSTHNFYYKTFIDYKESEANNSIIQMINKLHILLDCNCELEFIEIDEDFKKFLKNDDLAISFDDCMIDKCEHSTHTANSGFKVNKHCEHCEYYVFDEYEKNIEILHVLSYDDSEDYER